MVEYRGYTGVVAFDPELSLFAGHVIDLRDEIYFEGESVEELTASMRRAVDHYDPRTLQFILAHELDHFLPPSEGGQGTGHTDPPLNLQTKNSAMCGGGGPG